LVSGLQDLVAALEVGENPALAPGGATGCKPIHKRQTRAGSEMKFLTLCEARISEWLHRSRRKDQHCALPYDGTGRMATRKERGIAIDLGGGLCADKASGAIADFQIEPRLVAGD